MPSVADVTVIDMFERGRDRPDTNGNDIGDDQALTIGLHQVIAVGARNRSRSASTASNRPKTCMAGP